MATMDVFNLKNEKVSQIELADEVFGVEVKPHLFQEVVRNQLANRRSGTAKAKTRAEVKATGAKPFRQKGTGRARQGTTVAPHHVGGGVAHGPRPRDFSYTVPKKVRRAAMCGALTYRLQNEQLKIVEDFELAEIKTKALKGVFDTLGLEKALVVDVDNDNLRLSCRNLENYQLLPPIGLNVYDVLRFDNLVLTRKAVEALTERLTRPRKTKASDKE